MDDAPSSMPDPAASDAQIELTRMLNAAAEDPARASRLLSRVLDELKAIARRKMRGERVDHTLQPTALVHEAWLRLAEAPGPWRNRAHFYFAAADSMRRILVERARHYRRIKHGGTQQRVELDFEAPAPAPEFTDVLAVDQALTRLEQLDPAKARVVLLRYFAGLTIDETADAMDVSPATVKNEWAFARAWLHDALGGDLPGVPDPPSGEGS